MSLFSSSGERRAYRAARSAWEQLGKYIPSREEMMIHLADYVQQGILTPDQADTILQEASQFNEISLDPSTRGAQMAALDELQQRVDAGGLDPQALAGMREAANEMAMQERGQREAINANARARGIGGSGIAYANALLSQQGGAQRAAEQGYNQAALADQRRMEALEGMANLGGAIRAQDWEQEARKAQARDEINRFNAANRQAIMNANVDRRNTAQAANLAARQDIANRNVQNQQAQEMYNKGDVYRDIFNMQQARAAGLSGVNLDIANRKAAERAATINMIGGAVGGGASGIGSMAASSDPDTKTNVEELSASDILDALVPSHRNKGGKD